VCWCGLTGSRSPARWPSPPPETPVACLRATSLDLFSPARASRHAMCSAQTACTWPRTPDRARARARGWLRGIAIAIAVGAIGQLTAFRDDEPDARLRSPSSFRQARSQSAGQMAAVSRRPASRPGRAYARRSHPIAALRLPRRFWIRWTLWTRAEDSRGLPAPVTGSWNTVTVSPSLIAGASLAIFSRARVYPAKPRAQWRAVKSQAGDYTDPGGVELPSPPSLPHRLGSGLIDQATRSRNGE
jgi:hypothetical protein